MSLHVLTRQHNLSKTYSYPTKETDQSDLKCIKHSDILTSFLKKVFLLLLIKFYSDSFSLFSSL